MSTGSFKRPRHRLVVFLSVVVGVGAVAGGALAKAPPGDCGWTPPTQPLLSLGDTDSYFLLPGSSFESELSGWSLAGGAGVVGGSESYYVNDPGDSQSLALPTGSTATTPDVCVTVESPTLRFFVLNTGAKDAKLTVFLNFTDKNGNARTQKLKDIGTDKSVGDWVPTDALKFLGPINSILDRDGKATVSFTFQPKDAKGVWQIDDAYVDPLKSH